MYNLCLYYFALAYSIILSFVSFYKARVVLWCFKWCYDYSGVKCFIFTSFLSAWPEWSWCLYIFYYKILYFSCIWWIYLSLAFISFLCFRLFISICCFKWSNFSCIWTNLALIVSWSKPSFDALLRIYWTSSILLRLLSHIKNNLKLKNTIKETPLNMMDGA